MCSDGMMLSELFQSIVQQTEIASFNVYTASLVVAPRSVVPTRGVVCSLCSRGRNGNWDVN